MKWFLLPGLALLSSGALAQNVTPQSVATANGLYNNTVMNIGQQNTLSPFFGQYDGGDTPTTRRQREQRAQMAFAAYPELEAELARLSPYQARHALLAAEKKARWQRIKAQQARD